MSAGLALCSYRQSSVSWTEGRHELTEGTRVIGYVRVSTEEQGETGVGLDAQRHAIDTACAQRGWLLVDVIKEVQSGAKLNRPALATALARMKAHEADALVVVKLDRLSRSVHDASGLFIRAEKEKWKLVALDTPVDTTTPMGEAFVSIAAVFAQLERQLIAQRTKEGLAVKKTQGVRLGRRPSIPEPVRQRIVALRDSGLSLRAIVRVLNDEGVPTAQGGREWYLGTVANVLKSLALDRFADERLAAYAAAQEADAA